MQLIPSPTATKIVSLASGSRGVGQFCAGALEPATPWASNDPTLGSYRSWPSVSVPASGTTTSSPSLAKAEWVRPAGVQRDSQGSFIEAVLKDQPWMVGCS